MSTFRQTIPPLHPEGHRFVAIFAGVTAGFFFLYQPLGWVGVILTLWCAYFFRDPTRLVPDGDDLILAPADGVISLISEVPVPAELEAGEELRWRVSVFMNVFNVHVNRVPTNGIIRKLHYVPGKFINAELDKASDDNERQLVLLERTGGDTIAFVQIAGLIARRIVCYLQEGEQVSRGERFGLIRFGSRVDVYLPEGMTPLVVVGQKTVAGETILAGTGSGEAPAGQAI